MSRSMARVWRWIALAGTGSVAFGLLGAECSPQFEALQTVLLGVITGLLFFLSRNV